MFDLIHYADADGNDHFGRWLESLLDDRGPGYRVYYAIASKQAILLCEGGDKRTQVTDIQRAIARWKDWHHRRPR